MFLIEGLIKFADAGSVENVKRVDEAIKKLQERSESLSGGLEKVGEGIGTLAVGGAAIAGGLGLAVGKAAEFEQTMANINSVNELSTKQFAELKSAALHFGSTTTFGTNEVAAAMFELTKRGLSAEGTLKALPAVLGAAAAGGLNLADAAKTLIGIVNGTGQSLDDTISITDKLAKTSTLTGVSILDLGTAFNYVGQIVQQKQVTFDEVAASLGALSRAGLDGSAAGTALNSVFNQITNPSKDVVKAFGGMNEMWKQFTDSAGKFKSIPEIFRVIKTAVDKQSNDFQKKDFLRDFVGVHGEVAFAKIIAQMDALGANGTSVFENIVDGIHHADGAAAEMSAKRMNTLIGAFKTLHHEAENFEIDLGTALIPTIRKLADEAIPNLRLVAQAFAAVNTIAGDRSPEQIALLGTTIGQFATGVVTGMKEAATSVVEFGHSVQKAILSILPAGQQNAESIGKMLGKLAVFAAVIGPVILALAGLGFVLSHVASLFTGSYQIFSVFVSKQRQAAIATQLMTSAAEGLVAAWGAIAAGLETAGAGLLAFAANPVVLVIAAIAAIGIAAYLLYQNWDTVTAAIGSAWDWVVGVFDSGAKWIADTWAGLSNTTKLAVLVITGVLTLGLVPAILWVALHWTQVTKALSDTWENFALNVQGLVITIVDWFGHLSDGAQIAVGIIAGALTLGLAPAIYWLYKNWGDVTDFVIKAWDKVVGFLSTINWTGILAAPFQLLGKLVEQAISLAEKIPGAKALMGSFGIDVAGLHKELAEMNKIELFKAPSVLPPAATPNPALDNLIGYDFVGRQRTDGAVPPLAPNGAPPGVSVPGALPSNVVPFGPPNLPSVDVSQASAVSTQRLSDLGIDQQGLSAAGGGQAPTQVNVTVQPATVQADIRTTVELDGRAVGESIVRQQLNNSQRNGDASDPTKTRKLKTAGGFAGPVGQ